MDSTLGGRDPFMPTRPKGRGPAMVLAVIAHGLLILALALGVNWRSSDPATASAELWSAVPQAAAPRAVEPPPAAPPPEPKQAQPVLGTAPAVAPPKPPESVAPDPQIAIEKAKRDEARRALAEQEAQRKAQRDRLERERADDEKQQRLKQEQAQAQAQKKAAADKLKAEQTAKAAAQAERAAKAAEQADAAREAAIRDQNLKRMQGMAGATGGAADSGTALRSSGPSDSYGGRIMAKIKPNIVLTEPVDGNPLASVEVKLAPDGTITARRLIKSSGSKAWDDAVLRAIDRTEVLPRDIDGRVPPPFPIDFRPRDLAR